VSVTNVPDVIKLVENLVRCRASLAITVRGIRESLVWAFGMWLSMAYDTRGARSAHRHIQTIDDNIGRPVLPAMDESNRLRGVLAMRLRDLYTSQINHVLTIKFPFNTYRDTGLSQHHHVRDFASDSWVS
jgi:hypothetical protein